MYKAILSAVLWFLLGQAQAQQAGLVSLACKGTTTTYLFDGTENKREQPVSMGIIVDLHAGTVQGFRNYPLKIKHADEAKTEFASFTDFSTSTDDIPGSIDRVTGEVHTADCKPLQLKCRQFSDHSCKPML